MSYTNFMKLSEALSPISNHFLNNQMPSLFLYFIIVQWTIIYIDKRSSLSLNWINYGREKFLYCKGLYHKTFITVTPVIT